MAKAGSRRSCSDLIIQLKTFRARRITDLPIGSRLMRLGLTLRKTGVTNLSALAG
jgi:hypothetical protein